MSPRAGVARRVQVGLVALAAAVSIGLGGVADAAGSGSMTGSAGDATVMSAAQCPANYFCFFTGAYHSGGIKMYQSTGELASTFTVMSVLNNRSGAVRLYSGSGRTGLSICYPAGGSNGYVTGWSQSVASMAVYSSPTC